DTDLQPEHLVDGRNKTILSTFRELNAADKPIDLISVLTAVDPNSIGGAPHLQQIERTGNVDKFDEHVDVVMDLWREREKQSLLHQAAQENWEIDRITGELDKLTNDKTTDQNRINDLLKEVFEAPWTKTDKQQG